MWERNKELDINSFSIITTEANDLVQGIHDRMPVILKPEDEEKWLNDGLDPIDALDLLKPYPSDMLKIYPVDKAVGNANNKSPDLLKRIRV